MPDGEKRNYWISQGADVAGDIVVDSKVAWTTGESKQQILRGDVIYFWQSGDNAGIYGWGGVTSERPYSEDSDFWRFELLPKALFEKPLVEAIIADDAGLESELSTLKDGRFSLFEILPEQARVINRLIREMKQAAPPEPPQDEDEGELTGRARLTEREFFNRLTTSVSETLVPQVKEFVELARSADLWIRFGKSSLILEFLSPADQRVTVGMIRTDGTLDTRYVCYYVARVMGDPGLGKSYLQSVADLIGGTVNEDGKPWIWRVVLDGKRPSIEPLLERSDEWLEAIRTLKEGTKNRPTDPEDRVAELAGGTPTHLDTPILEDRFYRKPFAEGIGLRLRYICRDVWRSPKPDQEPNTGAFLVHLYAPWGAGKTTTLGYLEKYLKRRHPLGTDEGDDSALPWIVVNFDAWRHQHTHPEWWPLIKTVSRVVRKSLVEIEPRHRQRRACLWIKEIWWRSVRGRRYLLVSVVLFVLFLGLLASVVFGPETNGGWGIVPDEQVRGISAVVSFAAALWSLLSGVSRSLLLGSSNSASNFLRESDGPQGAFQRRFESIVRDADPYPVAIFVDNLDRCSKQYAVDFLEGIQTMFRDAPVAYVMAADRAWLCECFGKIYEDFKEITNEPGRPLGHLFLEKTFQISVPLPNINIGQREAFFRRLILAEPASGNDSRSPTLHSDTTADTEASGGNQTSAGKQESAASVQSHDQLKSAAGASSEIEENVRRLAQPESDAAMTKKLEELIQKMPSVLESNPRSIKRTVNAIGMWRMIDEVQRGRLDDEVIMRWAIAGIRWPALIDKLSERPDLAAQMGKPEPSSDVEDWLHQLFQQKDVLGVFKGEQFEYPLDETQIRRLLGMGSPAG